MSQDSDTGAMGDELQAALILCKGDIYRACYHHLKPAWSICQCMGMDRLSDQVSNDPNKLKREMERKRLFTAAEDEIMLRAWLRCALSQYLHSTCCIAC